MLAINYCMERIGIIHLCSRCDFNLNDLCTVLIYFFIFDIISLDKVSILVINNMDILNYMYLNILI